MVRIRVLGDFALTEDGTEVAPPPPGHARSLLAWLAVHPGLHSRAALAGRMRPDVPEASARKSLRQAVWSLRRSLGPLADRVLDGDRGHLGLDPERVAVDVVEQARLIDAGDLEGAVEIGGGHRLLPGFDDDWVHTVREEHRAAVAGAVAALADRCEERGDLEGSVAWSRRLTELEPLGETEHRALIRRLAARGDRAAAIAAHEAFAGRLRRELGIAPSEPTRRLLQDVRRGGGGETGGPGPPIGPGVRPALPGALARDDVFVGRREAMEQLRAALSDACGGALRAVVVRGEPGMGKTRLLARLGAAAHANGTAVLYGRSDEDGTVPFQPFVECLTQHLETAPEEERRRLVDAAGGGLGRLLPALAAGDEPLAGDLATERYRAFEAVRRLVERIAASTPTLLALDDLHWADDATLHLIRHLARTTHRAPLCLVLAYRHTEVGRGHALRGVLDELRREHPVTEVTLDGLTEGEVADLLAARGAPTMASGADAVRERTRGNPFFVTELARHAAQEGAEGGEQALPEGVKLVVERRVDRLGAEVGALLTVGAALGSEFEPGMAGGVGWGGLTPDAALDAADTAERAGLLVGVPDAPGRMAFAHALIAEAHLDGLTATESARLHRRVADVLIGRADAEPAEVARHLVAAGTLADLGLVADWSLRAGRDAAARLAYEEAIAHYRRALGGIEDAASRAEALIAAGDAANRAGRGEEARRTFVEAAEEARRAGRPEALARAALGHGGLGVVVAGADPTREALLREALERLDEGEHALRARVTARLAVEVYYSSRPHADALSRAAVEDAERSGDPTTLAWALNARRVALWSGDAAAERLEVASRMLDAARAAREEALVLQARNWRVVDLMELGRIGEAETEIAAYEELAEDIGLPHYLWYVPLWRATLAALRAEFDAVPPLQRRALELGRRAGDPNAELFDAIQRVCVLQEQMRHAEIEVERVMRFESSSGVSFAYQSWLAAIEAITGDLGSARERLEAMARDDFADLPRDANWHVICEVAETAIRLGDRARCARLHELLLPERALWPVVARGIYVYGYAEDWLGRLAAAAGLDVAAEHLGRAVEGYAEVGAPTRLALAEARLARCIRREDPGRAASLRAAAAERAEPFPHVAAEVARIAEGGGGD